MASAYSPWAVSRPREKRALIHIFRGTDTVNEKFADVEIRAVLLQEIGKPIRASFTDRA
jgi:hypothetical protein